MNKTVSNTTLKTLKELCSHDKKTVVTSVRHLDKEQHDSYMSEYKFFGKEKKYAKEQIPGVLEKRKANFVEEFSKLERKLLSFGGVSVRFPEDLYLSEIKQIVNRGQFWYGKNAKKVRGIPGKCHHNSVYIWSDNREHFVLATGFALSSDGVWYCHSWLIEPLKNKSIVVETTLDRVAYFGVVLNYKEAVEETSYYF